MTVQLTLFIFATTGRAEGGAHQSRRAYRPQPHRYLTARLYVYLYSYYYMCYLVLPTVYQLMCMWSRLYSWRLLYFTLLQIWQVPRPPAPRANPFQCQKICSENLSRGQPCASALGFAHT